MLVDTTETLVIFMEVQTFGGKVKELAYSHVIKSIRCMHQKHKNDPKHKDLQNILYQLLMEEDKAIAKCALVTLTDLYKRRIWSDERSAEAICKACFHSSPRIMTATLSVLLELDNIEDYDSDDSDREDSSTPEVSQIVLSKEAIYKASHKGTTSSKKRKQAKLQRVARSIRKQKRLSSQETSSNYYSPLNHLKNAESFVEDLYSKLDCNKFTVKLMILKVIARTLSIHKIIHEKFYSFLQGLFKVPSQRFITELFSVIIQACHDMVLAEDIRPLFVHIVNLYVHRYSRPEVLSIVLNFVRQMCLRVPLLMTDDLVQELVLYKKSKEKAVSSSARSLLTLFREICPSLLAKKDRGRPADVRARPKAFGEAQVAYNVPGIELLEIDGDVNKEMDDLTPENETQYSDGPLLVDEEDCTGESDGSANSDVSSGDCEVSGEGDINDNANGAGDMICDNKNEDNAEEYKTNDAVDRNDSDDFSVVKKRKFFEGKLNGTCTSLRALKKLHVGATMNNSSDANSAPAFLSDVDFNRIRQLQAEEARISLEKHGLVIPTSDQLSSKKFDAAKLEANIKKIVTKEQKLALVRAGREERGQYQARTALKQKKIGGLTNRQKEHKKAMPIAAKRSKIAKTNRERKMKKRSGKQFRGRKAWK